MPLETLLKNWANNASRNVSEKGQTLSRETWFKKGANIALQNIIEKRAHFASRNTVEKTLSVSTFLQDIWALFIFYILASKYSSIKLGEVRKIEVFCF